MRLKACFLLFLLLVSAKAEETKWGSVYTYTLNQSTNSYHSFMWDLLLQKEKFNIDLLTYLSISPYNGTRVERVTLKTTTDHYIWEVGRVSPFSSYLCPIYGEVDGMKFTLIKNKYTLGAFAGKVQLEDFKNFVGVEVTKKGTLKSNFIKGSIYGYKYQGQNYLFGDIELFRKFTPNFDFSLNVVEALSPRKALAYQLGVICRWREFNYNFSARKVDPTFAQIGNSFVTRELSSQNLLVSFNKGSFYLVESLSRRNTFQGTELNNEFIINYQPSNQKFNFQIIQSNFKEDYTSSRYSRTEFRFIKKINLRNRLTTSLEIGKEYGMKNWHLSLTWDRLLWRENYMSIQSEFYSFEGEKSGRFGLRIDNIRLGQRGILFTAFSYSQSSRLYANNWGWNIGTSWRVGKDTLFNLSYTNNNQAQGTIRLYLTGFLGEWLALTTVPGTSGGAPPYVPFPRELVKFGDAYGYVFEDKNGNGKRDLDEPGIPGMKIKARGKESITDEQGKYNLAELSPGLQVLEFPLEQLPENAKLTTPQKRDIELCGGSRVEIDWGIRFYQVVAGIIFEDIDGDRKFTPQKDIPLSNIIVKLGNIKATTDSNGRFKYTQIPVGKYLFEIQPETVSALLTSILPLQQEITLTALAPLEMSLPMISTSFIKGKVYLDKNEDLKLNPKDEPLADIAVFINTEQEYTYTDENGEFVFDNLLPGDYIISFNPEFLPSNFEVEGDTQYKVTLKKDEPKEILLFLKEKPIKAEITFKKATPSPPVEIEVSPTYPQLGEKVTITVKSKEKLKEVWCDFPKEFALASKKFTWAAQNKYWLYKFPLSRNIPIGIYKLTIKVIIQSGEKYEFNRYITVVPGF